MHISVNVVRHILYLFRQQLLQEAFPAITDFDWIGVA
ncbi:hypothetical protein ABIB06_002066 [Bradyrhizobium sp. LB8.2]|jgi:hypothetical protein